MLEVINDLQASRNTTSKERTMSKELLSLFLSSELDRIGFSKHATAERVAMYRKRSDAKSEASKHVLKNANTERIIVGSKMDGVDLESSDIDVLEVNHNIVCVTDEDVLTGADDGKLVLKADLTGAPAGHVFLKVDRSELEKKTAVIGELKQCFIQDDNGDIVFLSADKFVRMLEQEDRCTWRGWLGRRVRYGERSGPAVGKVIDLIGMEADLVAALAIRCPGEVKKWQRHERQYEWPPRELIEMAEFQRFFVVPVGQKDSENEHRQWRVCFTETEQSLVHSMTDTQLKVYVLLKILAKNLLKPVTDDITSYVIKNVMFWLLDGTNPNLFKPECLIERLEDALRLLQTSVERRELKTYMLHERNLLAGKIEKEDFRRRISDMIANVLDNATAVLIDFIEKRFKPSQLQSTSLRIFHVHQRLERHQEENKIQLEKMKVLDKDRLVDLHIRMNNCLFPWQLFWWEMVYVFIPYTRKYGCSKLLTHVLGPNTCTHSRNMPEEEKGGYVENYVHVIEPQNGKKDEAVSCSTKSSEYIRENEGTRNARECQQNPLTWLSCIFHPLFYLGALALLITVWYVYRNDTNSVVTVVDFSFGTCVALIAIAVPNQLLEALGLVLGTQMVVSKILLGLLQITYRPLLHLTHFICIVYIWVTARLYVMTNTIIIDTTGMVILSLYAFSFRNTIVSTVLNITYLLCVLCVCLFVNEDQYKLYFHELFVMFRPTDYHGQQFRKLIFEQNNIEDYLGNMPKQYYA